MIATDMNTKDKIRNQINDSNCKINFTLSFDKFLDKLGTKLHKDGQKSEFERHWIQELNKHKNRVVETNSKDISGYQSLFEFIQHSLFAPVHGKDLMWGLVQPVYPYCIHATPALSGLLAQDLQVRIKPGVYVDGGESYQVIWRMLFYSFILHKLYGFSVEKTVGIVARIGDPETELMKYFRFEIDTSYLEVTVQGQLPALKIEDVSAHHAQGTLFDYLHEILPENRFIVTGFASVKVIKDTTHSVLEDIRAAIINQTADSIVETTKQVLKMLKSLVQNGAIQFGLLPFLKLNGKLINFDLARQLSIVLNTSYAQNLSGEEILSRLEQFHNDPMMIIANKKSGAENSLVQGVFEKGQIQTIALLPIYHQSHLVGLLEIASTSDRDLEKQINVFALEQAMPFLAELVYRDNSEFNNQINQIVQAKFTSIHTSVQWKINESALLYLKDQISNPQQAVITDILFKQVYPMYGAVDIRNSTIIRNNATCNDLTIQLTSLIKALQAINNELDLKIIEVKLGICRYWLQVLKKSCNAETELSVYSFIETEVNPLLEYYKQYFPQVRTSIMRYYDTIDPNTGAAGKNKRAMEKSMHIINNAINNQIEVFGNRLQSFYPSYFESFRTDGVEYDIYLGQSIAPRKPFDNHYLHEYRLLQLISMAEIARNTHSLLSKMEVPMQTTQLIYASNRPIDISFRNDEKRFDVEGDYNIRYQIIKKRIDKAYIKGTDERLTQPGKIAVVYLDNVIKKEYEKYIMYGQQQGYFKEEVEFPEIEELQDISGLKAIRVGIKL